MGGGSPQPASLTLCILEQRQRLVGPFLQADAVESSCCILPRPAHDESRAKFRAIDGAAALRLSLFVSSSLKEKHEGTYVILDAIFIVQYYVNGNAGANRFATTSHALGGILPVSQLSPGRGDAKAGSSCRKLNQNTA